MKRAKTKKSRLVTQAKMFASTKLGGIAARRVQKEAKMYQVFGVEPDPPQNRVQRRALTAKSATRL